MYSNKGFVLRHLLDSDFQDFIKDGVSVVDFWAEWCGPCRAFGPVFEAVAAKHAESGVKFAKFEITDDNKKSPVDCGVRSIPAIIAFKDGQKVKTQTGLVDGKAFEDWIKELL